MKYENVIYTTHHLIGGCGNITEYFRDNSRRCYVFSMCPTFIDLPTTFTEYINGRQARQWSYYWYRGNNIVLKYVFIYLYFVHARLFRAPHNTDVVAFHPLFCVGNLFFRWVKGGQTVFWIFDFFDQWEGLYKYYNWIADFYVGHLDHVLFLGEPMRAKYEERVTKRPSADWGILNLGIKVADYPRMPETGLMGFIGNLKHGQGLEQVMDAMVGDQGLRLEIIGAGVTLEELKEYAAKVGVTGRIKFLGQITSDQEQAKHTAHWQLGVAMYAMTKYTPYADPGKIKLYVQLGVPVLTTDATMVQSIVTSTGAGVVVPLTSEGVADGIRRIQAAYPAFAAGTKVMAEKYEFRRIYGEKFAFLEKHPEANAAA